MENTIHNASESEPHMYDLELTDTFAGEANYSWVLRKTLHYTAPYSEAKLRRDIKAALGLTGIRCRTDDNSATYWAVLILRPVGMCQIAFAVFRT